MTDAALHPGGHTAPNAFTRAQLDWLPWVEPVTEAGLTGRQRASLVDAGRASEELPVGRPWLGRASTSRRGGGSARRLARPVGRCRG